MKTQILEAVVISQEEPGHSADIEALNAYVFGPGRFVRAAHLLREGGPHRCDLSFVAFKNGMLLGSCRITPITMGSLPYFLLGPAVVTPEYKGQGLGSALIRRCIEAVKEEGAPGILLIGPIEYYARFGFRPIEGVTLVFPAPVAKKRVLFLPFTESDLSSYKNSKGEIKISYNTRQLNGLSAEA